MAIRRFARGVEGFVRSTQEMTEGFEDVFGEDMKRPGDDVRRDKLMRRVAADSPSASPSLDRKLGSSTRNRFDLSFGRRKRNDTEEQQEEQDNSSRRFF